MGMGVAQHDHDHDHNYSQEGSLYSTDTIIFGKQRGTISACPTVNPHLFVTIRDEIIVEQESNENGNGNGIPGLEGDTQDLTDASATASATGCILLYLS